MSALPEGGACKAAQPKVQRHQCPSEGRALKNHNNMLKVFTVKYEEITESFNDEIMLNFCVFLRGLHQTSP